MKRTVVFAVFILSAFSVIAFVINNEKNKKTPYERFAETSETTERKEFEPRVVYNEKHTIKYEILSYELIDGKDIAKQTKYPGNYFLDVAGMFAGEYFLENHLPNPDYLMKDIDYAAMKRDYPLYAEYCNSYGEKGMTEAEAEEFMEKHEKEYATIYHPKTKYLFLHCRFTNVSNTEVEELLYYFDIYATRNNKFVGADYGFCYFDGPVYPDVYPGWHKFERGEEPLECVIGFMLVDYRGFLDLSEPNTYYYGKMPRSMDDIVDWSTIDFAGVESLTVVNDSPE